MVSTLSFHLSQEKVPAVDWRQDILLFPAEKSKEKTDVLSFIIQENRRIRYKKLFKKKMHSTNYICSSYNIAAEQLINN